ncbi:hypothetical protein COCC4DRAFT_208631 [Bipolaris maydis ATCC 48331]|uniref:Multicopper oxidase n=2 Tax=Cochliobolus heterostrophus TaxID=5016 RepID=M2U465_COCH5|nr:uncharacterized protein COCC4DRAFT_208631 [Bipolaris maydis ATCC 48331]EMD88541.1 hypothetical protein COCHEDRAFT_1142219 [Bipolaris maydis C5]KAJ5026291.1 Cupredoxin [Bipolaris maydis]ENH99180.1 hypothetical protein COCC4DRAFT_208631 [Bipolaris maydis ATCC 48331]KAJ5051373.1 multicopper oxidase 1 [Bipolaris maydis]KAJ6196418.1 multicopper oxidase 1 [Bipolaris maydis]
MHITRAACLLVCAAVAYAKTVSYDFTIGYVTAAPDGFSRQVIGINGKWPIPTIECDVGDTLVITVHNGLPDQTTSLHFHGIWQTGTQVSDGPSGITQCPIRPGQSYTYTFVANPAGTHWYHAHEKGQYPDGLRGKMIVHDRAWEKTLGIDKQIFLSMSDWFHRSMPELIDEYMSPDNTDARFDSPNAFLFNDSNKPFDLKLAKGKKYLLRIVNTAAVACGQFHMDNYTLSVVEVDGVQVQPQETDRILICAGQSYGVVVKGQEDPKGASNWHASMDTDMLPGPAPPKDDISVIGRIVYDVMQEVEAIERELPNIARAETRVLDDFHVKPLDGQKLLGPVNNRIDFTTNQTYFEGIGTRTPLNADPWVAPKVPTLYTALTTGSMDPATYGPGVNPWIIQSGEIVQIHMNNPHGRPHPMHLHGHVFQVVAKGAGTWDGQEGGFPEVPSKRDGLVVPANGHAVIRFKADNPGVWFFHCHVDFHAVGGMAATIIESPNLLQGSVPEAGKALCDAGGMPSSGNCAGESFKITASEARDKCNTVHNTKVRAAKLW